MRSILRLLVAGLLVTTSANHLHCQDAGGQIHLPDAIIEAGFGMGHVTFVDSYQWNGNTVPGATTETWFMPQFYFGGRIPFLALGQDAALHAVIPISMMLVVGGSSPGLGVVNMPAYAVFRYGYGSTKQSNSVIGIGVGAGAAFQMYPALQMYEFMPQVYGELAFKDIPIFLRSSVNLVSVDLTNNTTFSMWSVGLAWKGFLPKKDYLN